MLARTWTVAAMGLRGMWMRARTLPRVLEAAAVADTVDARAELHLQCGRQNWLEAIWALRSFYFASGRRYRLCVHDDGTLDDEALGALAMMFPHARTIARDEANREAVQQLSGFPVLQSWRARQPRGAFLVDVAANLEAPCALIMSPATLFLEEPRALVERIDDARFTVSATAFGRSSNYTKDAPDCAESFGATLIPLIHPGLALVRGDALTLTGLAELAERAQLDRAGQDKALTTSLALTVSRHGVELLPADYSVRYDRELPLGAAGCYPSTASRLYWREGMRTLVARAKF